MDRPPVCEMVKRHEVWSANPLAMGNQQSKSAGLTLTCAWFNSAVTAMINATANGAHDKSH